MFLIQGDWPMLPGEQSGVLTVGMAVKHRPGLPALLSAAVREIQGSGSRSLVILDPRLALLYQGLRLPVR